MKIFNKKTIQNNFNRFSSSYSKNAILQKQVAHNLCQIALGTIQDSNKILDLGSGTGFVAQNILANKKWQSKSICQLDIAYDMLRNSNQYQNIFNINGDIENLPFKNHSFDFMISSLAFQWLNNLDLVLKNIKNLLHVNGQIAFAILLHGTLHQLKESAQSLAINLQINDFITQKNLEDSLNLHFSTYEIKVEEINLYYQNIFDLLHSIKNIGAATANINQNRNNITKKDFLNLNDFYLKNFNLNSRLVASWKVAYAIAKI